MGEQYQRATEDVGNLIEIGHLNVSVPDQRTATDFYVSGLGLTRDPYLVTGTSNMWINVGRHQFHLPTDPAPQRMRGTVGLIVPDLDALRTRLRSVAATLQDTAFAWSDEGDAVAVTGPWGNRFRLHAPDARFGPVRLGMAYLEFDVPPGAARGIAEFYRKVFGTPAAVSNNKRRASVPAGDQALVFNESDAPLPTFDGHHIQVYISDFSAPYRKLGERGLVTREDNLHQYRFAEIVALDDNQPLFTLEHEVRSLRHPMFGRPLVNRDASVDMLTYVPGREAFIA